MIERDFCQDDEGIGTETDTTLVPKDTADPQSIVEKKIPTDLLQRFEFFSYRNAAVILAETRAQEWGQIADALRQFSITTEMIRTAGGNESEMPKLVTDLLRPKGWYETTVQGDLVVRLSWKEEVARTKTGKPVFERRTREMRRERYLDGHKIDYVKNRVAFDFEWNSKDQTFDRDLYAFSAFFQSGVIDVGVIVTRSVLLNPVFRQLGPALKRDGSIDTKDGKPRLTHSKYGASTTWMGKLLYRLNAGRNGGCPVLAVGIRPECISDWRPQQ